MNKKFVKFLKKIVETPSPTGFETAVADIVRTRLRPSADFIETDTMGSVHAVYEGSLHSLSSVLSSADAADPSTDEFDTSFLRDDLSKIDFIDAESLEREDGSASSDNVLREPRVLMLSTHMDEIGLMVSYISSEGFLSVGALGGVDAAILPGMRVDVHAKDGTLRGVVGRKPIHLINPDERKNVTPLDQLVIDLGISAKAVKKKVRVGDPITFAVGFERMGSNMAVSRAFDDKVGVFISCRVFEELSKNIDYNDTFVSAITTQEEIGTRGAMTSAYSLKPDVALAFDVTHATDYPGIEKSKYGDIKCGKGPVIARGPNINPVVFEALVAAAEVEDIPYQLEAEPSVTGTDARAIQVTRDGIPTGLVSVPLRYMHTPTEMIDLRDVENTIRLIVRFALDLKNVDSFVPAGPRDYESKERIASVNYIADFDAMRDEIVKMREELDDLMVENQFGADIVSDVIDLPDDVEEDELADTLGDAIYDIADPDITFEYDNAMYNPENAYAQDLTPAVPDSPQYDGTPDGEPEPHEARSIEDLKVADFRDELINKGYPDDWKLVGVESPFQRQQGEISAEFQGIGMNNVFTDNGEEVLAEDEIGVDRSYAPPNADAKVDPRSFNIPSLDDIAQANRSQIEQGDASTDRLGAMTSATSISDEVGEPAYTAPDPFASEASDIPTVEIDIDEDDDSYYDFD